MARPELTRNLFTDFYELTMAQAYWRAGQTATATFSLFFRAYPPNRGYFVSAGLSDVLDYLEQFHFAPEDLAYLRSLGRFDEEFLAHLGRLRFTGDVRAMPEGTLAFANEPVLEVTAPVLEAQLAETFVVNQVNLQTILATKAARVVEAARGRPVVDFAARRAQGVEAADALARVGWLVGMAATSNTRAAARFGLPVSGTMAHSFITSFANEIEAFRAFARSFPDSCTFLVDTYDTLSGTRHAALVAEEMNRAGHRLHAIRLDSGNLLELSRQARAILDLAGLADVRIFASGGLDEYGVDELVRAGAPIDAFGVGTKVGVAADAPWTDCVYKLVAYAGRPVLKLSAGKETLPSGKQVFRERGPDGIVLRDTIARADEPAPPGAEPLLLPVIANGQRLRPDPTLDELRRRFGQEFARLPEPIKSLREPARLEVRLSAELQALQRRVVAETHRRELGAIPGDQTPTV